MDSCARKLRRDCLAMIVVICLPSLVWARDRKPPKIRHAPIAEAVINNAVEVRVAITDRSGVFDPTLYYRLSGATEYLRATLVETGAEFVASIPAAAVTGDIEYFVEAYDELGNGPARVGSPAKPLRIAVGEAKPDSDSGQKPDPDPGDPGPADDPKPDPSDTSDPGDNHSSSNQPGDDPGTATVEDDEEELPWAIIAGASGAVLAVAVGVTLAVVFLPELLSTDPPGEVTLVVSGPAPTRSLRGEP